MTRRDTRMRHMKYGLALTIAATWPALAQTDDDTRAATLAPIDVEGAGVSPADGPVEGYVADRSLTATKTDIPLIESPQSISVIGRAQMEDRGADALTEAVEYSPGITVLNRNNNEVIDDIGIVVRGFQARDSIYRDGSRNYSGLPYDAPTETYGLERVEVLRGPSSVLYGQGDPGGIINLVTKRPTAAPLREFGAEFGSYHHKQLTGDISDKLDENGHWRYRLTGLMQDSETDYDYGFNDRIYVAPALSWTPNDRTSLTLLSHYQKNEATYRWTGFPLEGTKRDSEYGRIPSDRYIGIPGEDGYNSEVYSVGYLFEQLIGDRFTFRQNVRYREIKYDVTDIFRNYAVADPVSDDLRTLSRSMRLRRDDGTTVTADNQFVTEFDHGAFEHQLLVGFDYKHIDYDSRGTSFTDPTADIPPLDLYDPDYTQDFTRPTGFTPRSTDANQYGLYLQDHVRFADRWALTVGARQDWVDEKTTDADKTDQHDLTWRAGLVYLADNGLAPYVSYSESFSPQYGVNDFTGQKYDPITGEQYEAGLRYRPSGFDATFSIAAFEINRQNELVSDPLQPTIQTQIGETRSRGIELGAEADLATGLSAIASYTYNEVEVVEAGGDRATNGKRVVDRPDHLAKLWLNYDFQAPTLAGLGVGAGVRYTSSSFANADNTARFPSATLVDAAVRYDFDNVRLQVSANNLLDEVKLYCYGSDPNSLCDFGTSRNVVGSITYRWD